MRSRYPTLIAVLSLFASTVALAAPAADPVTSFIATVDADAAAGNESALADAVKDKPLIVGAAVAQLLDDAFVAGDAGAERIALAARIAQLSGSAILQQLVARERAWSVPQRRVRSSAMAMEADAVSARNAGANDRAVALYDSARVLYATIGDLHSVAVNWGSLGVTHWQRGDMDAVIAHYDSALAARRWVEDRILEGRTLNGLGSAYLRQGDLSSSIRYYGEAIDLRRRTGDISGLGTSLNYMGNSLYLTGRLVDARDYLEEALPILEANGSPRQIVEVLISIGNLYADMGRNARSNEAYERAVEMSIAGGLPEKEVTARINLATNHQRDGRYAAALDEYTSAEAMIESGSPADHVLLLRERARAAMAIGDLDRARDDLVAGLALSKTLPDPSENIGIQISLGYLYGEYRSFDRALAMGTQAKQAAIDVGNRREYRIAVLLIAEMQRRLGMHDEALMNFREALEQDEASGMMELVPNDRVNVAVETAAVGRVEEARSLFYDIRAQAHGNETFMWAAHFGIGHTFEKENPDSAAWHYDKALEYVESTRGKLGAAESEGGFLSGDRRYYYEEVARYYATQAKNSGDKWIARAFHTMERARSRVLLDQMEAVAQSSSPQEEKILDEIYRLDRSRSDYRNNERQLRAQLATAREARVTAALGSLGKGMPTLGIDELRKSLPQGTAVLSYALGDTASLLFVCDRRGYDVHLLKNRFDILPEVERLRDAVRQPGAGDKTLRSAARSLYDMLVAPGGSRATDAGQLLIFPDGFLFEIPFEMLIAGGDSSADWRTTEFLGRSHTIVYAPSATVYDFMNQSRERRRYDLDLLAFGAPDFSTLVGDPLAPLPHAADEVLQISKDVPDGRRLVRTGAAATESAYKEALREKSPRIVHLATHGLVDANDPAASCVALARDPATGDDGLLHTLEIASMSTRAGMVVMSACESGLGRRSRGEGVLGLTRAYIASGASGVVASLWAVSDESTAQLMRVFYERMMKKKSAGEAMYDARMALLDSERFSHPFYWAPFVVVGSSRAPW